MKSHQIARDFRNQPPRSGAAAVEAALCTPLLIIIAFGSIDVGQFVNVGQTINNASREGARRAVRESVTSTSDVEWTVNTYIANSFPNVASSTLEGATTITITKIVNGTETPVADLTTVNSGEAIAVSVSLNYDAVRWTYGFAGVSGQTITTKTRMRRE